MIGSSGASLVTGAMISAPRTGWAFIFIRSSRVRRSCLSRMLSGTPILPTSWRSPPHSMGLQLGLAKAHHPPDVGRDLHHAFGMVAGERVTLVHGLRQAGDGLREHLPHFDESV